MLVYVAGGVRGQAPLPLEEVEPDDFREIVEANLTGAFLFARAVAPGMKRAGRGRIVTISSRAGARARASPASRATPPRSTARSGS